MENKNYGVSGGLNTIHIAYSLRTHDTLASLRRQQENSLPQSHPRPSIYSPTHATAAEPAETAFNDFNLKYGKSQTLKEAVFNRLRIHIYRRDKRPKWLEIPDQDDEPKTRPVPKETKQSVRPRENKTSMNSRSHLSQRPPKLKTVSAEEPGLEAAKLKGSEVEMVDRHKLNSIVRSLIEKAKVDEKSCTRYIADEEFKLSRRNRNIPSKTIRELTKPHPFAFKKLLSPPRLIRQTNQTVAEDVPDSDGFDAWENSDLSGSHRNGIEEYTKEHSNPESPAAAKRTETIFVSKKRRRFVVREKK